MPKAKKDMTNRLPQNELCGSRDIFITYFFVKKIEQIGGYATRSNIKSRDGIQLRASKTTALELLLKL